MSSDKSLKNNINVATSFPRRGFLQVGAALGASFGAGLVWPNVIGCGSPDPAPTPPVQPVNPEFFTPALVEATGGLLDIEMTITATKITVGGYTFMTRAYTDVKVNTGNANFQNGAYSGKIPGPSIVLRPGDTFKLKLVNNLAHDASVMDPASCGISSGSSSSSGGADAGHHGPGMVNNTTNFHTHGLHVDPRPLSDDVLLEIDPGTSYDFTFNIPKGLVMPDGTMANHPAGTYWYHPHVHGSTAIQVFGGMAGALLIRDEADDDGDKLFSPNPMPGQGKDQVLVLGEFMLQTCNGQTRLATYDEIVTDAEGTVDFFHINGQVNPVLRMRPSEVQRFRIIHAGFHFPLDFIFVRVPDDQVDPDTSLPKASYQPASYPCPGKHFDSLEDPAFAAAKNALRQKAVPYYQIATDGVSYAKPIKMPLENAISEIEYLIGPGGRSTSLVQFDAGTYQMVSLGYDLGFACSPPQIIATIVVSGAPDTSVTIPTTLKPPALYPPFDDMTKPGNMITNQRTLQFQVAVDNGATNTAGYHFTIDGNVFCEGRVDQCVTLGAVEEWTINNGMAKATFHPFHIHVNSFLVTEINGKKPANAIWRDTLLMPKTGLDMNGQAGSFKFLSRFLHYQGNYVLHCHMLQHEDLGMMQIVQVSPDGTCMPPSMEVCP